MICGLPIGSGAGVIDMENWIIISKLIIVTYCIIRFAGSEMKNTTAFVLVMLIFVCLNMMSYIVKKGRLRKVLLFFSIIWLISCFWYENALFILLLPVNILELVFTHSEGLWLPAVLTVIPMFFQTEELLAEYILISLFSFAVHVLSDRYSSRVRLLSAENDRLRENVSSLSGRLDKDIEYERQMRYSSQLEERNKIAQEIHDRVGHAISGSLIQLEAARLLMDKDGAAPEKSGEIIQNVIGILREGMESIRVALRNIKPAAEQLGINRIKLLADEFAVNSQIRTVLRHDSNLERISHIQWKVIHDNINEALTNSLKYSRATSITIDIGVLNKFVKAEVRDNGIGAYVVKKGLGINGMEERSGSIGGSVVVDGSRGFSVITLLPLEPMKEGSYGY